MVIFTPGLNIVQASTVPGSELMLGPRCSRTGVVLAEKEWVKGWWLFHPDTRTWQDLGPETTRVHVSFPSFSEDGRMVYGLATAEHAVLRFDLRARRFERVADLQPVEEGTSSVQAWMGLAPGDAPLVLRDSGIWDLYVLDWERP